MVKTRRPGVFGTEPATVQSGPVGVEAGAESQEVAGLHVLPLSIPGSQTLWAVLARQDEQAMPRDLVAIYRGLRVAYSDPQTGAASEVVADIHTYVNAHIPRRCPSVAEKDELVQIVKQELRAPFGQRRMLDAEDDDRVKIAHTFSGQGSPEEVRITLRYALTFGRTTADRLQRYCDEDPKIGLDCVGFVMNYFMFIGRLDERLSYIDGYAERGAPRLDIDELRPRDVLIWQSANADAIGHIAVVDRKDAGSDRMMVAESCGSRGLSVSEYAVLEVRDGLFTVHVTGGATSHVRIYEMP